MTNPAEKSPASQVVASVCFIPPAALIVIGIASAYVRFGKLPQAEGITDHQAFFTREALMNIAATAIDNITKFENHQPLEKLAG